MLANKKIVFIHIPKTAGTALGEYFDGFFKEEEIARIYTNTHIQRPLKEALANPNIKFIRGHFGLYPPLLEALKNEEVFVFTFLREPVSRLLSSYLHLKGGASAEHNKRFQGIANIKLFLAGTADFNIQTRLLSSTQHVPVFLADVEKAFYEAEANCAIINFIGRVEQMATDLPKLLDALEITSDNVLSVKNRGGKKWWQKVLRFRYQKAIAQREKWDVLLYALRNKKAGV